jgi:hypothetical protein
MGLAAVAIGASVVANVLGSSAAASAKRRAAEEEALRREAQAVEEERRSKRELSLFKRKSQAVLGDAVSSYAKAGVNLSDSALLNIATSSANLESDAVEMERQSKENARLIRMGAAGMRQEARDIAAAQPFEIAGTVLSGIGKLLGKD